MHRPAGAPLFFDLTADEAEANALDITQVRKALSWPRSWAGFSLS
jgi:hypothetical protein